jgi:hypothetical protein
LSEEYKSMTAAKKLQALGYEISKAESEYGHFCQLESKERKLLWKG